MMVKVRAAQMTRGDYAIKQLASAYNPGRTRPFCAQQAKRTSRTHPPKSQRCFLSHANQIKSSRGAHPSSHKTNIPCQITSAQQLSDFAPQ